jgi:hypothetical protein
MDIITTGKLKVEASDLLRLLEPEFTHTRRRIRQIKRDPSNEAIFRWWDDVSRANSLAQDYFKLGNYSETIRIARMSIAALKAWNGESEPAQLMLNYPSGSTRTSLSTKDSLKMALAKASQTTLRPRSLKANIIWHRARVVQLLRAYRRILDKGKNRKAVTDDLRWKSMTRKFIEWSEKLETYSHLLISGSLNKRMPGEKRQEILEAIEVDFIALLLDILDGAPTIRDWI